MNTSMWCVMISSVFSGYPKKSLYSCMKSQAKMWLGLNSLKTDYKLLEKTKKLPVENFPPDSWALPTEADKFTRVKIGKKSDKNYEREVVTFYDKEGKLIKRYFRGTGMKNKIREYKNEFFLPRCEIKTNGVYGVDKRSIKTSEFFVAAPETPYLGEWKTTADEEQFVYSMFDKTKGYRSAKKIHINKNEYKYDGENAHIKATCVEYPMNLGFEKKSDKKVLSMDIGLRKNRINIEQINPETNVKIPTSDEYLPYRMLVGDKKQECLAQHFLDKKGVGDMGINIETNRYKVSENAVAYFSSENGEIVFKDVQKYNHPVMTSSHESEHAYQYSLIGRLGRGKTYYEKNCRWNKGSLTAEKDIEEAKKYAIARDNYPILDSKEDLSKNKDYMDNYLEVKAREASKKATEIYEIGRKKLMDIFKYVGGYTSL